jgi:hypothetical protein
MGEAIATANLFAFFLRKMAQSMWKLRRRLRMKPGIYRIGGGGFPVESQNQLIVVSDDGCYTYLTGTNLGARIRNTAGLDKAYLTPAKIPEKEPEESIPNTLSYKEGYEALNDALLYLRSHSAMPASLKDFIDRYLSTVAVLE